MTFLITSDTHFTATPRDEYRWGLFPWLRKMAKKHDAGDIIFCGDLTDAKDRHPSTLVNRLVEELDTLASNGISVWLLKGNHDYVDADNPFFDFLSKVPHIKFITKPTEITIQEERFLFLPSTRDYDADWAGLDVDAEYIFCHQTFDGSVAENGMELRGIPPGVFKSFSGKVISGDIHVPQDINKQIKHVGSPYRIHFGDTFTPRVLLLKDGRFTDLHFPCISREVIVVRSAEALDKYEFPEGTQVKIRVKLKRAEYPEWTNIRKQAAEVASRKGWQLCGLELVELTTRVRDREIEVEETRTPETIVREYGKDRKLDKDMVEAGVDFLKDAT